MEYKETENVDVKSQKEECCKAKELNIDVFYELVEAFLSSYEEGTPNLEILQNIFNLIGESNFNVSEITDFDSFWSTIGFLISDGNKDVINFLSEAAKKNKRML